HILYVYYIQFGSLVPLHPFATFITFQGLAAVRDLHSFPTRRSSDLCAAPKASLTYRSASSANAFASAGSFFSSPAWKRTIRRWRSEEHTSELQSRENLVCRLLLEKKKDYDSLRYNRVINNCSIEKDN